jgi:hypothetical protein
MVGSEGIKLVCNGENGQQMETCFTIWFYEIVCSQHDHSSGDMVLSTLVVAAPALRNLGYS